MLFLAKERGSRPGPPLRLQTLFEELPERSDAGSEGPRSPSEVLHFQQNVKGSVRVTKLKAELLREMEQRCLLLRDIERKLVAYGGQVSLDGWSAASWEEELEGFSDAEEDLETPTLRASPASPTAELTRSQRLVQKSKTNSLDIALKKGTTATSVTSPHQRTISGGSASTLDAAATAAASSIDSRAAHAWLAPRLTRKDKAAISDFAAYIQTERRAGGLIPLIDLKKRVVFDGTGSDTGGAKAPVYF